MIKNNILRTFCFLSSLYAYGQKGDVLIQGATVITITQDIRENTDVLIQNGKIAKIDNNIIAPIGIKTIDAKGMFIMPGIIDAHSHIGLDVVNEASNPVTAEVNVGDAINPYDVGIYRALAGGVTISHAMHGSANAIGGQCQTIKHKYGTHVPDELKMEGAPRTIKFALGENPMRVHGEGQGILPKSRMGIEQVFRSSFSEAKIYRDNWNQYKNGGLKIAPEYNHRMETVADILEGKILIHCHSYRADEILMLMNVCKDFGIKKLCFQHVNEGFKVAPELAEFGASASVFSDWWAYKFEVYYSTAFNAAILTKNGVITSINSDDAEMIRHLYHEAGKTQRYGGLSDDEALRLITINPAKQLGIENRVGSIEIGKDGDIAIFDKHPLSVYAIPQYTIIDGVVYFDRKNDKNDKRIDIDPEEKFGNAFYEKEWYKKDNCMEGVTESLFLGSQSSHTSHKH